MGARWEKKKQEKTRRKERKKEEGRDRVNFQVLSTLFFPDLSNFEFSLHPLNFATALIIRNVHLSILYFPLHCCDGLLFTH